eukprot:5370874-Prymnesium_polylepis.1
MKRSYDTSDNSFLCYSLARPQRETVVSLRGRERAAAERPTPYCYSCTLRRVLGLGSWRNGRTGPGPGPAG